MNNNLRKMLILAAMSVVLGSMVFSTVMANPAPGPTPIEVGSNKHEGTIAGNETNQFQFQNRFRMQLRVNQSLNVSIDCEGDGLADRDFEMDLNTSQTVRVEMTIRTENSELGLTNGSMVQNRNRNQYRYRYQEQFMINVSLNESVQLQARLAINSDDSNAVWAYYDETEEEWVPVQSSYENGMVVANTDHFSTWTVLTPEEDGGTTIPAFSWIAIPTLLGTLGLVYISRKKQ